MNLTSLTSARRSLLRTGLATLALLTGPLALRAADPAAEPAVATLPANDAAADRFTVRLGAFLVTNIDTSLSLRTEGGAGGTLIDFGDTLGGETSANIFRIDADWQISGPHRVEGAWYDINLTGHRVIDREIEFGDETFPLHAELESSFRTSIYKLSYGYTFRKNHRHEFTGLIGAHVMRLSTKLTAPNLGSAEGLDVTAPLPAFGINWTAHWTHSFETRMIVQYFGISIDDKIEGHFLDFTLAAEYRLSRHFSIGGGYNRFDLDVEAHRGPLTLNVEDTYDGFLAYLAVHF